MAKHYTRICKEYFLMLFTIIFCGGCYFCDRLSTVKKSYQGLPVPCSSHIFDQGLLLLPSAPKAE